MTEAPHTPNPEAQKPASPDADRQKSTGLRQFIPLIWIGALAIGSALIVAVLMREPDRVAALPQQCNVGTFDKIGGPIDLIDETGAPATQASFTGKPTLLYFGFANCPDICPMSLTTAGAALALRAPNASPIQTVLVSIDPARDTPQFLANYVKSGGFPPGLKALTGPQAAVDQAVKAFAVYAQRVDQPQSGLGYVMDHSSNFYLMDKEWKTVAIFPSTLKPDEMATCLDRALEVAERGNP